MKDFRYKGCLIIGNGFDLNMQLPTSYSNFLESEEWKMLLVSSRHNTSLISYIEKEHSIKNWNDLEAILLKYAKENKDKEIASDIISEEYESLAQALFKYLFRIAHEVEPSRGCFAEFFLRRYLLMSNDNPIYSFNYTPLEVFADVFCTSNSPRVVYVHGSIKDKSLILGIECDKFEDIAPQLSFLMKSNSLFYQSTDLHADLMMSENVYIFGHSLNYIDKDYIQNYLLDCTKEKKGRRIVFITKDAKSDRDIRDNIRKMGVSVLLLFQYCNVFFVHTDEIQKGEHSIDTVLDSIGM